MTTDRKFLILQTRNLGDAVIGTGLIQGIHSAFPTAHIDVLTRESSKSIFVDNPAVNQVFTGEMPMGSVRNFGLRQMLDLICLLFQLRKQNYTDVLNLMGDFREDLLGRVLSHRDSWSPLYATEHPMRRVTRPASFPLSTRSITIPASQISIYDVLSDVSYQVGNILESRPVLYTGGRQRISWKPLPDVVGIHPSASQPWKRWDMTKFYELSRLLLDHGQTVRIFGSPSEADHLREIFGKLEGPKLQIVTGGITCFFSEIAKVRVLVSHDSFASHAGHAIGIPLIFLNGANDYRSWAPPGATVLAEGPKMQCYPCFSRPKCIDSVHEFGCIRRIEVGDVLAAVLGRIKHPHEITTISIA